MPTWDELKGPFRAAILEDELRRLRESIAPTVLKIDALQRELDELRLIISSREARAIRAGTTGTDAR